MGDDIIEVAPGLVDLGEAFATQFDIRQAELLDPRMTGFDLRAADVDPDELRIRIPHGMGDKIAA